MKAAVFKGNSNKLIIENLPIPELSKEEILIKVVACGVCHTDLHYIDHGVATQKKPPIILGHEATGIVEKSNNSRFKEGDRVLLPAVFTCGHCEFCLNGRKNLCKNMQMLGNSINGAFAEYIKVPSTDVLHLPDEIPIEEGCIIADAISTPYHAVFNRAKVNSDHKVLVYGCGGVGINVIQLCAMIGANVIACDNDDKKLALATELGANYTINPEKTDLKAFLKKNTGLVDISFEVIGTPKTIESAFKTLGMAGKLCIIGYTNQNISINPAKIMFYEQEIIGSIGCSPDDYSKIFKLLIDKKIDLTKLISNKYNLSDINFALDELRASSIIRNIILL